MASIPFTKNYLDMSNSRGFQFRFFCEKCGNGYVSTFKANSVGTVATAARGAAAMLGGVFGRAAMGANQIQQLVAGPQHDAAFKAAVEEITPTFKQCPRCGKWVCEPVCWNAKAGLCELCAPDLDEEIAAARAQAAQFQAMDKAMAQDYIGDRDFAKAGPLNCGKCGTKLGGAKFCPECGTPAATRKACASCGADVDGSPKFCPECGKPMTG